MNRADFQKEIFELWRVVVVIVLAQISAGCVAVILEPYGFWVIDFWFGGAVATVFGFIAGVIWQLKSVDDSWQTHRQMLLFIGILSLILFVAAFAMPLDQAAAQNKKSTRSDHESVVKPMHSNPQISTGQG